MNPILMEDLLGYRFLSGITVSPFENRAVFTVAVQDARSNGYKKNLWQVDPFTGKTEKLTSHGKAGAFLFEKAGTLLCQKPGKSPAPPTMSTWRWTPARLNRPSPCPGR